MNSQVNKQSGVKGQCLTYIYIYIDIYIYIYIFFFFASSNSLYFSWDMKLGTFKVFIAVFKFFSSQN